MFSVCCVLLSHIITLSVSTTVAMVKMTVAHSQQTVRSDYTVSEQPNLAASSKFRRINFVNPLECFTVSRKPLRRKQFFALFPINSVSFAILFLSEADLDRLPPSSEDGQNFPEIFLMQFLFIEKSKKSCLSVCLSVTELCTFCAGYEQRRLYSVVNCPNINSVHTRNQLAVVTCHF